MSLRNDLINKLEDAALAPDNEFDRIIAENKDILGIMDEKLLSDIYTLRRRALSLCRLIPYERREIESLVDNREVSAADKVAELADCFNTAEYIFAKAYGKDY